MRMKIIRDNLHGYISIPEIIFSEIIDTPIFQRLKRIEQTSMRSLYPSARHDRFIHSLGVYYLGGKAIRCLVENIKTKETYYDDAKKNIWDEYGLLFELACLLHDCGHAPFSHSFEKYYLGDRNSAKSKRIKLILTKSINELENSVSEFSGCGLSVDNKKLYKKSVDELFSQKKLYPHEIFSAIIVAQHFSAKIKKVCEGLNNNGTIGEIKVEHIEFIQRTILGMKYNIKEIDSSERAKFNILNCLIQLLNSRSVDVDKLDYILRDSAASGTNNLIVDVDRILSALMIVETHKSEKTVNINRNIENSVIFRKLDNSKKILINIKNDDHEKCELILCLKNVEIEGKIKGEINIIKGEIKEDENVYGDNSSRLFKVETHVTGKCEKVEIRGCFIGELSSSNKFEISGFIRGNIEGKICGKIIGAISSLETSEWTTYYEIGYKKTALSVVEDTITARNRVSMWTHAHHKVTYFDYLLRNAVLVKLLGKEDYLELNDLLSAKKKLEGLLKLDIFDKNKDTFLLDDSHFITMIRQDIKKNNVFAQKYFYREKEYSIWKSYAEYNIFFGNLSRNEKKDLWRLLFGEGKEHEEYDEGNLQLFPNSILKKFNENKGIDYKFIWIKPSGIKLSKISKEDTYMTFDESVVRRLKDIVDDSDKTVGMDVDEKSFFYLYSSSPEFSRYENKLGLSDFLKKEIQERTNREKEK